jgi:hypothetical protein
MKHAGPQNQQNRQQKSWGDEDKKMSNSNYMGQMPSLVLGGRVNHLYLLANAILQFQTAIIKPEGLQSEQETRESALCFYYTIPKGWWDEEFIEEKAKAVITEVIDQRNEWCGKKCGNKIFEGPGKNQIEEEKLDPYRLYSSCINLLDRKHLLTKVMSIEKELELAKRRKNSDE